MATVTITPASGQGVFEGNAVEQVLSDEIESGHGVTMSAGTAVSINDQGLLIPAQANSEDTAKVLGLLHKDLPAGESGRVIINGATSYALDPISPALEAGQRVYLSATSAGAITGAIDQIAGSFSIPVGKVVGNVIYVEIGDPLGTITKQLVTGLMENGTDSTMPAGTAVASDADGRLIRASADSAQNSRVFGFTLYEIASGGSGRVVVGGESPVSLEPGNPPLTNGATLFLSAGTPGTAATTPAGIAGGVVLPLGKVVESKLYIEIGEPILLG